MNYIIVLTFEEFGYIFTSELDHDTIYEKLEVIFFINNDYDISKLDKIKDVTLIAQFMMKGNMIYFGINHRGVTNGIATLTIVLKGEKFCLQSYIRERENFSVLLLEERFSDDYTDFHKLFPDIQISAN